MHRPPDNSDGKSIKVVSIVGARPNFMKIAPIIKALAIHSARIHHFLVHTGQHYDDEMSGSFFKALDIPKPDVNLGVGSDSHAKQTGRIMIAIEPILREIEPNLVIVVGDVNSTLACALVAKKLQIKVAHIEAGLRSFDMTMPEEINRLCTDAISDHLFTTDRIADENLKREGIDVERIHFVGNVMIDSLLACRRSAERLRFYEKFNLIPRQYGVMTMHRPANVDSSLRISEILQAILDSVGDLPVIFPAHPRTRDCINRFGLSSMVASVPGSRGISMIEPLGYTEFLSLSSSSKIIITDSGGIQEEATILGIQCVTVRDNTERPITVTEGTNRIAGTRRGGIMCGVAAALKAPIRDPRRPERWDGRAAERIVERLMVNF